LITYYLKEVRKQTEGKKDGEKEMDRKPTMMKTKKRLDASTSE